MKRVFDAAAAAAPTESTAEGARIAGLTVFGTSDGEGEVRLCRRQFLQFASGVALTAFVVPALAGCEVGEVVGAVGPVVVKLDFDVAVAPYTPLANVGNVIAVDSGSYQLLLVRTSNTEVVALDRLCTHQACDMSPSVSGRWASATFEMTCRCHNARFNCADGTVLQGPATVALHKYGVTFDAATGKGSVVFA